MNNTHAPRRHSVLIMVGILVISIATVTVITIWLLSRVEFEQQQNHLIDAVESRAALLQAVADFDAQYSQDDHPEGANAATLSQLSIAQQKFEGFGESGEYLLAKQEEGQIVFLTGSRHLDFRIPYPTPMDSVLAEPMRLALTGKTGSVIGLDYRGVTVLAAYKSVARNGWGLVAKIDLDEVHAPFIKAALYAALFGLLFTGISVVILLRISAPIVGELQGSEAAMRSIVDTAVDGIIGIDERGTIQQFNKAAERIFGYNTSEVLAKNVKMLMPEPYHSAHDGYLSHYRETRERNIIGIGREVVGLRKDGSTFPVDLAVSEVEGLQGRHLFIGIVRDITLRKEAEQALIQQKEQAEENDRMKSEFLNMMSHELRTPLTVLIGYLPLLTNVDKMPNNAMIASIAEDMNESGQHLLTLINDLLDISKIESGSMVLHREWKSCDNVLKGVVDNLRLKAEEKGVELFMAVDASSVFTDEVRLRQILINLIGNAIKFTDQGEIRVTARPDDGGVVFAVRDTGHGIPPEDLPRIFEKFHQVDSSSTRDAGGTGLGLAICKHLVAMHGGDITASSELNKGSIFTFTIPDSEEKDSGNYFDR